MGGKQAKSPSYSLANAEVDGNQEDPEKILCLRYTTCYCGAALLYLLIFVLMLISTLHQYWSRLGPVDNPHLYGLFRLNEGPRDDKYTTWNCVKKIACQNDADQSLCATGTDLHAAGSTFFALELFAYLSALYLVERFTYLALRRGFGWGWMIYVFATLTFVLQAAAIISWFAISGADYDVGCEAPPADPTAAWDICADDGSKIAIAVATLTLLGGIYACVSYKSRPLGCNSVENTGGVRFVCMPARWVMGFVLIPMIANIALLIVSLLVSRWSQTNGVHGSLWYTDSWLNYENYGYDCIAFPNCGQDPDSGICKTFRDLTDAGLGYMSLEIAALFMFALWIQPTIQMVAGMEYGYSFLNYLSGALCFFLHFVATISWFGVSQADFSRPCNKSEFDPRMKWEICAETGPQIAVANCVVFCVSYPLWALVYYNRKGQNKEPADTQGIELRDNAS